MFENRLEEIQGAAACYFILPPLQTDPMLHASETWPLKRPDLLRLRRNDRDMIRRLCNVKPEDVATVRSNNMLDQLEIDYLDEILREKASLV